MNRLFALIGAVLALLAFAAPASAQDYPPRPAGPVYDGAAMLSPATVAALDARLRQYNAETGRAIIVATVPSLNGQSIDPYATGLFANWGIGGAERDMGLLLLVAKEERKVRIEVGYGLHPWFGGIMSGRVIRDVITPQFKAGDFDAGVTQGVDAILAHLAKSPEDAAAIAEAAAAAEAQRGGGKSATSVGAVIFWVVMIGGFILVFGLRGRGRRHRRYGDAAGVVGDIILWSAINAISDGDGGGWGGGGDGGGGGFGGFGGGMSGGGGASGSW